MKQSRQDYEEFLRTELEKQVKDYEQIVSTRALVLKGRGDVFVGRFVKLQSSGIAIFKVRSSDNMPKRNSYWTASCFIRQMGNFNNWSNYSWADLRREYQRSSSEALCIWLQKSDEKDFFLVGIKNLTTEFAELLEKEKPIIAFGPQDPPLQYLINLVDLVRDVSCNVLDQILGYDEAANKWNPTKIGALTNFTTVLLSDMQSNDCIVVQGPPGTGKTYRMAQLAAALLTDNNSVLVTALTNQALMELAKKEDIKPFLYMGKVSKTSLKTDEAKELPQLLPVRDNLCNAANGCLTLATFFFSSGWAKDAKVIPFDYVIMDEASQALLPMIAATKKLGKKIILIGDQNQLAPIVKTNIDTITDRHWNQIVRGFETVCRNISFKSYMLSDTFRLTKRGAEATGVFYDNLLCSVSATSQVPSELSQLHPQGGPVFIGLDLDLGTRSPQNAIEASFDLVTKIQSENPKAEIAVLSKFRESIRSLQKYFVWNSLPKLSDNIRIDTIDSVQGLTVDYCLFFIPNDSLRYSLEKELFNVATSRARYCTIIVADNNILRENMANEVRKYILKSQEDKFAAFAPQTISAGNVGITVVGKIDLSKFERKRREIVNDKENIYIIDTNVFVNCPDIISRIGKQYKVIVPAKVLEELDRLKLKVDVDKKNLSEAAKNINTAFVKRYSRMEEADLSLLPNGFDKRNPDCMILSVALKHRNENPILLTSDNMLQSRASGLGITTISLKEFLGK